MRHNMSRLSLLVLCCACALAAAACASLAPEPEWTVQALNPVSAPNP